MARRLPGRSPCSSRMPEASPQIRSTPSAACVLFSGTRARHRTKLRHEADGTIQRIRSRKFLGATICRKWETTMGF
jgi:hypothetical protein